MKPWWTRYIGMPFGDGPGQATCWSLIVRVYADRLGIALPAYGEISAIDLARVARTMEVQKDEGWLVPQTPDEHDVVLMRAAGSGRRVVHVGIMTDPRHLLHVEAASAAVRIPVDHWSVVGRILGFRRLAP